MQQIIRPFSVGAVLALALAFPLAAAAAGYLKIGDIKGESTDKGHKDEIVIESWSWGETAPTALTARTLAKDKTLDGQAEGEMAPARLAARTEPASGRLTGERRHQPITIVKRVDKASPKLQQASVKGRVFPSMKLEVPQSQAKGEPYLILSSSRSGFPRTALPAPATCRWKRCR